MFKPYPLFVGWRYTRARRRNHFVSFNTLVSMLGVALGVAALIVVLSVMNGFEQELRARILGVVSHITASDWSGRVEGWEPLAERLASDAEVTGVAPFLEIQGLLVKDGRSRGVLVRGVLPEHEATVADLDGMVKESAAAMAGGRALAALQPAGFRIYLGNELAYGLGALPGDRVTLLTPQAQVTPAGVLPRLRRFEVAGLFSAGMHEYDSTLAFIHMTDAQRLARMGDAVQGLRLKVRDLLRAPLIAERLAASYPQLAVTDWTRQHVNFFRAVRTEKVMMFLILLLIVGVAAFNIVATLVMVVADKRGDIAILRTMGSSPKAVMLVFIVQGAVIGLLGTLLGTVGGVLLALNVETLVPFIERLLGIDFWPSDVYYIADLPSDLRVPEVVIIASVAFLICLLATLYPARRAALVRPAEALRYE